MPLRTELDRAEHKVESHSAALRKPLGLGDLVLTQIVFVVGASWAWARETCDREDRAKDTRASHA